MESHGPCEPLELSIVRIGYLKRTVVPENETRIDTVSWGQVPVVNAAAANEGRAKHLVRSAVLLKLALRGAPNLDDAGTQETPLSVVTMAATDRAAASGTGVGVAGGVGVVVVETPQEESDGEESDEALSAVEEPPATLLAIDLGLKNVGIAAYDASGALVAYDSVFTENPDDASAALVQAAERMGLLGVAHVVAEGSSLNRLFREQVLEDLVNSDLVADHAADRAVLVKADDWRAAMLSPRERKSGKDAKHAARLAARQIIADQTTPVLAPAGPVSTDAAEAICLGKWAAAELGWRTTQGALLRRYMNGDIILPK